MQKQLGWTSVFAHDDEDFGPESLLGRTSDTEAVLVRDLAAALRRLNPGLPEDACREAQAQVLLEDVTKTLLQSNEEKYKLLRDGVPVKYRDTSGGLVDRRLKLIDFDDASNNNYLAVRPIMVEAAGYHLLRQRLAVGVCRVEALRGICRQRL